MLTFCSGAAGPYGTVTLLLSMDHPKWEDGRSYMRLIDRLREHIAQCDILEYVQSKSVFAY